MGNARKYSGDERAKQVQQQLEAIQEEATFYQSGEQNVTRVAMPPTKKQGNPFSNCP